MPTEAASVLLDTTHDIFAALERCERVLVDLRESPRTAARADGPRAGMYI